MTSQLDCGDHSCMFAADKSGQRTNAGCRCLDGLSSAQRHQVNEYIRYLKRQIEDARGMYGGKVFGRAINENTWTVHCPECEQVTTYTGYFDPEDDYVCICGCKFRCDRIVFDDGSCID